jgi:hypothetical protein
MVAVIIAQSPLQQAGVAQDCEFTAANIGAVEDLGATADDAQHCPSVPRGGERPAPADR